MAAINETLPGSAAGTPSAPDLAPDFSTAHRQYVGKHRKPDTRRYFSLFQLFYVGRHRAR